MDLSALKQQARTFEQQGQAAEALATYQQVLVEIDAIGGIRNELPLLIKVGDLLLKAGDTSAAVDQYERAAEEYATQGAAQPVSSLCMKAVRVEPQYVAIYLHMARKLLENGYIAPARELLMDYAQRTKLEKTREGLEKLAGQPDDQIKRVLDKAITAAEQKAPARVRQPASAPAPAPGPKPRTAGPPPSPSHPPAMEPASPASKKRLTVELGAIEAEPDPALAKQHKAAEKAAEQAKAAEHHAEVMPEMAFPTAADLQAPVMPPAAAPPPAPAKPAPPPPPSPPSPIMPLQPLPLEPLEPPKVEPTLLPLELDTSLVPSLAEPPRVAPLRPEPPRPEPPRVELPWAEPPRAEPPRAEPPRIEEPPPPRRPSRGERPPPPRPPFPASAPIARPRAAGGRPGWLWPLIGVVVVGGGAALVVMGVIPAGPLKGLLSRGGQAAVTAAREATRAALPADTGRSDTLMARDTAVAAAPSGTTPSSATAHGPQAQPSSAPAQPPPSPMTLPPGVTVSRPVIVVQGLTIADVKEISEEGRQGFEITQVLPSGGRVTLHEFPSDSAGSGEISVSGLAADTVIGTTWYGGFAVTLRGVLKEEMAVELLQQLVEVRPRE